MDVICAWGAKPTKEKKKKSPPTTDPAVSLTTNPTVSPMTGEGLNDIDR